MIRSNFSQDFTGAAIRAMRGRQSPCRKCSLFLFSILDEIFNISSSSARIAAPLAALDAHGYGAHIQAAARVSSVRIAFAAPENLVRTDIGPKKLQV
jgi:hypothetical protein